MNESSPSASPDPTGSVAWDTLLGEGAAVLREGRGSGRLDPRREAETLLRAAVGRDAAAFLVERRRVASGVEAARFRDWIRARARGVPLQHLVGRAEFHGVTLRCTPGVFIPRPETELLVEIALDALLPRALAPDAGAPHAPLPSDAVVLELCTGTGAVTVAIAAALAAASSKVPSSAAAPRRFAGDVDPSAVDLARSNASVNGVAAAIEFRVSDLFDAFEDLAGNVDILLANPPYIDPASAETLPVEVRIGDPPLALFDPEGGIGFHRRIASQGRRFLREGGLIAMEIGDDQGPAVAAILGEAGYDEVRVVADLAGRDRVARGRWTSSTRFS